MKIRNILLLALVAMLTFVFTGCASVAQKATESAIEKSTGVKVDQNNKSIKIKTDKGETEISGAENKLPDGFPKDFPLYTDAKISGGLKATVNGKESFTVTLDTQDSPTKVVEFYKTELPKAGYQIGDSFESSDGSSMNIKKDGKDAGGIMVAKDSKKTSAVISLTQQ